MARLRRLSLRQKILAASVGLVVFLSAAIYLAVHFIVMPRLESEVVRRGYTIARAVSVQAGGLVVTYDRPHLVSLIFEKRQLEPSVAYLMVTDAAGRPLADTFVSEPPAGMRGAHPLPAAKLWDVRLIEAGDHRYYDTSYRIMEGLYPVGTVRVGLSKALVDDVMDRVHLALLGVMGALVVGAILASNRFSRQISRPLSGLTRAAEEIGRGNLDVQLGEPPAPRPGRWHLPLWREPEGPAARDELELLTGAFAHMVRQLKHSRDQLRQAYDFQENLLRSSPDAVVATDERGRVVLFNEGAERLFGYPAGEVLGRLSGAALYPPGVAEEIEAALGRRGRLSDLETWALDKAGRRVQVALSASVIHDRGRPIGAVTLLRDLTERKRLEEEMQRADRLATVGRAVAYITHEIKNPLMVIGGLARQVAAAPAPAGEKEREKLAIVIKEIKRLEAILLEIGEYTKSTRLELEPVALPELLAEVLQLMEGTFEKRRIEVVSEMPEGLPAAEADPLKLKQVFINLIKNAADAMPRGGRLSVGARPSNGGLEVSIRDTGEGIPPEAMRELFTPFFTTKPRGTGLGLAISRRIVEDHHGELHLSSTPGEGTECLINLPAATTP